MILHSKPYYGYAIPIRNWPDTQQTQWERVKEREEEEKKEEFIEEEEFKV